MRRFFIIPENITQSSAILAGAEAHHIKNVLRLKIGTEIRLFDGKGGTGRAMIEQMTRDVVRLTILDWQMEESSGPTITLGQGLLTGQKMELIIQKATELGIHAITPFISQHSTVRRQPAGKNKRWEKISLEACKQCGRPIPLEIREPMDFTQLALAAQDFSPRLIFWEKEQTTTLDSVLGGVLAPATANILFLIGPEGGFSTQEIDMAVSQGFAAVTLGGLTLRAETAALAAMAIVQYLVGNLKGREQ
jgi:16S rRNA (uracil1498-N3)-methyltransferase